MNKSVLQDLPELMQNKEFKSAYDALDREFSIARSLIEARSKAQMTQHDVAEKMGVTQSSIARIESGKNISIKTISRYASALGVPVFLEIHPE